MSDQPDDPAAVPGLGREAGRQILVLAFTVAGILAAAWAERRASQADGFRSERMRAYRAAERASARAAGMLWRAAERARRAYERESA
jgi:hypothetical protein